MRDKLSAHYFGDEFYNNDAGILIIPLISITALAQTPPQPQHARAFN